MRFAFAFLAALLIAGLAPAQCRNGSCSCAPCNCYPACNCDAQATADGDALPTLNGQRAAKGLPAYARDDGLSVAALAAARYRARYRIRGHVTAGMGDFAFLPPGCNADAAGCACWPPTMGFGACCMDDTEYHCAGAATVRGADGMNYHHLFVRRGRASAGSAGGPVTGAVYVCVAVGRGQLGGSPTVVPVQVNGKGEGSTGTDLATFKPEDPRLSNVILPNAGYEVGGRYRYGYSVTLPACPGGVCR
jgi:hypothetical protein